MEDKIVIISEQQKKFLKDKKHILFEYFAQVSNPRSDSDVLGNTQVWIYGDDRKKYTPHCHIMQADRSIEFEVSLIDFEIINIKKDGNQIKKMLECFYIWLDRESIRFGGSITNKKTLYSMWDATNDNNTLLDFVEEHNIDVKDGDLLEYLEYQKEHQVRLD